jgi:hemoglobin
MSRDDFCTEEEVTELVHRFYAQVREDPELGPIFDAHVTDWPSHLSTLVDFWSSALRGTARFRGAPLPKHMKLPLTADLFGRWLFLFRRTTAALGNAALEERANDLAQRIASSFWYAYRRLDTDQGAHAAGADHGGTLHGGAS